MSKRDKYIEKMIALANDLVKNYTWEKYKALWDMTSDWNSTHSRNEEIFMSEYQTEDSEYVNGFMIEDDYWIFEE